MSVKTWKKIVLSAAVLGILLAGCGCICLFHPDHCGSEQGYANAAALGSSAHEEGAAATADLSAPVAKTDPGSSAVGHHGLLDPRSPWTWAVGGGMLLMMVLMIL